MTNFQKVKNFMETFGQEVKSRPSFSSDKINMLRYNLIKEELDEFKQALENNTELPKTYSGYSFHSYDTLPLPTKYLKNYEVLKLRDEAFINYHTNKKYLKSIEKNFGREAMENIQEMTKIKLKRKII